MVDGRVEHWWPNKIPRCHRTNQFVTKVGVGPGHVHEQLGKAMTLTNFLDGNSRLARRFVNMAYPLYSG